MNAKSDEKGETVPTKSADNTPAIRIHRRALALTAILFGAFVAVTGLYSVYGERFVFFVFELQQQYRADAREGRAAVEQYEDYLRADPSSRRMRGRLVDELIRLGDYERAVDTARQAPFGATNLDRTLALLLQARATLAIGDLDVAAAQYERALQLASDSGEAHFGLAQIHAAKGDFARMREAFAAAAKSLTTASTEEFAEAARAARDALSPAPARAADALNLLRVAQIDRALAEFQDLPAEDNTSAEALFWQGVANEAAGNLDAARNYYRRAADAHSGLARLAANRLSPPAQSE